MGCKDLLVWFLFLATPDWSLSSEANQLNAALGNSNQPEALIAAQNIVNQSVSAIAKQGKPVEKQAVCVQPVFSLCNPFQPNQCCPFQNQLCLFVGLATTSVPICFPCGARSQFCVPGATPGFVGTCCPGLVCGGIGFGRGVCLNPR
ncbi:uncharacterized protein LOC106012409 [Aplysia californica]|uniref:Uncharacterized protein LOC106012409 n=1 Tax=Aplysia californica TaxID=6500 RepID=A0ABM1A4P1_APLCA|nr:uncharacterized protein LOC106012409 [Aplysia californica]